MYGARGVALGLNFGRGLNDLNISRNPNVARQAMAAANKKKKEAPKVIIQKRVDRQTLWAACRALIFGCLLLALGMAMATLGYYAEPLARFTNINQTVEIDEGRKMQFASLSYIGPVVMGVGAFILMIACVMTLESRDKHARILHELPPTQDKSGSKKIKKDTCDKKKDMSRGSGEEGGSADKKTNSNAQNQSKSLNSSTNQPSTENNDRPKYAGLIDDDSRYKEIWRVAKAKQAESSVGTLCNTHRKFPSTSCLEEMLRKWNNNNEDGDGAGGGEEDCREVGGGTTSVSKGPLLDRFLMEQCKGKSGGGREDEDWNKWIRQTSHQSTSALIHLPPSPKTLHPSTSHLLPPAIHSQKWEEEWAADGEKGDGWSQCISASPSPLIGRHLSISGGGGGGGGEDVSIGSFVTVDEWNHY